MRYYFFILVHCFFLSTGILWGQCPPKNFLWKRIVYLRDSSGMPHNQQMVELMPYLDNIKSCPYRNDSTHALLLQRIGALHLLQNDFVSGIAYTRQSLDLIYQHISSVSINPRHLIKTYNNLRLCYDSLKNQQLRWKAVDSCIAVAIRFRSGYEYALPLLYERVLNLMETGDYYRCISYAALAENIAKESGYALEYRLSFVTWNINALIFLKKFGEAEKMVTRAITECKRENVNGSLGTLYALHARITLEKGDIKRASALYQEAFLINRRINNTVGCAQILNNMGYLLYFKKLSQYDAALTCYYKALSYASPGESLNIFDNIANVYVQKRKYDSAHYFFQKGFDQISPGINETDLLRSGEKYISNTITEYITNLMLDKAGAWLAYYKETKEADKLNTAVSIYKTIDRVLDNIKTGQNEIESKLFWRTHIHQLYENAIEACYLQNNTEAALYFFEKSRAVLLADELKESRVSGDEDIMKQSQVKRKVLQLEREILTTDRYSARYAEIQKEMFFHKQELDRLQQAIKENNPLYFQSFLDSSLITIADLQKTILKDHQAFVELFAGDSAVYMLFVTAKNASLKKINKNDFDKLYDSYITAISNAELLNRNFASFVKISHELYRLLFHNLSLPQGRIIISPAGLYFPFEALVTSGESTPPVYFINDHAVSYTYSASYLLNEFVVNRDLSSRQFMGVAPVQYTGSLDLPALAGSDQSLLRIRSYFNNADNLTASAASKNNFLRQFYKYQVIQLYTHATDSGYGGEPVIYFADSALLLSDLIYENRPATRMIILSACETGKGNLYRGEGIFSFSRGFASLGVPASVSNLWQVDNESTYRLTEFFCKHLAAGLPADIALRKAKIEFISSGPKQRQLPYYWSAPILIGRSDAVAATRTFNWIYIPAIIIVAVMLFLVGRILLSNTPKIR